MLLASVHTAGVNWESVGVIVGGIATALVVVQSSMFWLLSRRERKRDVAAAKLEKDRDDERQEVRDMIADAMNQQTAALNHQTEVLMSRLETKEVVAQISVRLARLEGSRGVATGPTS